MFSDFADDRVLAFTRGEGANALYCVFNLSGDTAEIAAPAGLSPENAFAWEGQGGHSEQGKVILPAYSWFFGNVLLP